MVDAILIGFGAIAFAIGAALYVAQLRQGLRADASKRWPTTAGIITASALEQLPQNKRRYRAAVRYSYQVGAKEYDTDRIFWGGTEGRRRHMASVVDTYPAGSTVPVHYNPQDPAEAVIDPTQHIGSRALVVYAMAMMTLGLFTFSGGVYALMH